MKRLLTGMPRIQRGTSLIEVLVALVLVAVTMLGLLSLQLRSQNLQRDSFDRRMAASIVAEFADRLTSNYAGFEGNSYANFAMNPGDATPAAIPSCNNPNACDNNEIALRDWAALRITVRNRLPGAVAFVTTPANQSGVTVTLGWLDVERRAATTAGAFGVDPTCAAVGINDDHYRCFTANAHP